MAQLLSDPRFEVRDQAAARLSKLGAEAVPAISRVLAGNRTADSKCAAVWALARIDGDAARAAVRAALDDPQAGVRQAAARAAGLHRDHQPRGG